jgi:hypothetical protein
LREDQIPFSPESFALPLAISKLTTKIHRTLFLPVVLYGFKTLILSKEHRLSMYENRVLRKIFGPNRHKVRAKRRKIPNEELNDLYSSSNIVRGIKSRKMG